MESAAEASDLAAIASATVDAPVATAEAGPAEPATAAAPAANGAASDAGIQIACHIVPNLGISAAQPSLATADALPTAEAASMNAVGLHSPRPSP